MSRSLPVIGKSSSFMTQTFKKLICDQGKGGASSSGVRLIGSFVTRVALGKMRSCCATSLGGILMKSRPSVWRIDIRNASHHPIWPSLRLCKILIKIRSLFNEIYVTACVPWQNKRRRYLFNFLGIARTFRNWHANIGSRFTFSPGNTCFIILLSL